jgi:Ca2+-transporting ATPase
VLSGDVMDPWEPHRRHAHDVVEALRTDLRRGLTDAKVSSRLQRYGRNELATEKATSAWVRFLAQFQNVLVILLLIATGISAGLWAYERDSGLPYEAIAILAVVLLNATLGYVQQARAEAAVAALRAMSAADAAVMRNGERRSIPAAEIVPGDIILIEEGDTIPADARLLESAALQTAEAALTGESLPVSKDTDVIADDVALGDRHNMIFSGTAATYERAGSSTGVRHCGTQRRGLATLYRHRELGVVAQGDRQAVRAAASLTCLDYRRKTRHVRDQCL